LLGFGRSIYIVGNLKRKLLCWALIIATACVAGLLFSHGSARAMPRNHSEGDSSNGAGVRSFEIVPLETVSETSSNASIGDLNGDGIPDIVLVKGRHWQVPSLIFFGDGKGHFTPGPPLPSKATKSQTPPAERVAW